MKDLGKIILLIIVVILSSCSKSPDISNSEIIKNNDPVYPESINNLQDMIQEEELNIQSMKNFSDSIQFLYKADIINDTITSEMVECITAAYYEGWINELTTVRDILLAVTEHNPQLDTSLCDSLLNYNIKNHTDLELLQSLQTMNGKLEKK